MSQSSSHLPAARQGADAGRALVEVPFRLGFAITGVVLTAAESAVTIARITANSVQHELNQAIGLEGDELGSARTPLRGWYLRADETVGIDTQGRYYVLSMPLSLAQRLRGVRPESQPVPMTIGEGGRDGDIVPLRFALDRLLPGWEERSPEPLV